ncbi:MAG: hypothetical protein AB1705_14415 [Verrucomicrobiota bacterium]
MNDDFYIGYNDDAPAPLARHTRKIVAILVVLVAVIAALAASRQNPVDVGVFEFGTSRAFEGVLYETPLPMLRVARVSANGHSVTNFILVGFGKHGLPAFARGHDGKKIRFHGTLIQRENLAMIELNDAATFQVVGEPQPWERRGKTESLGRVSLTGELVDTKCFLGVMRPATGKVHRGCAIRCLSGGVPPGLLVRDGAGNATVLMLAGPAGEPLLYDVQWAARVVRCEGTLELHDGLPVLRTTALSLGQTTPPPGNRPAAAEHSEL